MKLSRMAGAAVGIFMILVWAGCGDTFRPVVTPISGPGGDPQAFRLAVVLHQGVPLADGTCAGEQAPNNLPPCQGAVELIDVAGDSDLGNRVVGRTPVDVALFAGFSQVFTANSADQTLSVFSPFGGTNTSTTITLPTGTAPEALANTAANLYVADPSHNNVVVVSASQDTVTANVAVGHGPVALAATPDNKKVYVANRDDNSVSVISTTDNTVANTVPVGATPVSVAANSKLPFVYVLNQGAETVSVIDTTNDAPVAAVALTGASGSSGLFYDSNSQRLYVTNPGSQSVSILDASQNTPVLLKTVTDTRLTNPRAIAPLPDGTRAYIVDAGSTTGCAGEADTGRVLELSTSSNTVTKCINVGKSPAWIAASGDSTKVFVPHQAAGGSGTVATTPGTSIIHTTTDIVAAHTSAPFTDPNCTAESATCVRMTPVKVVTTP